MSVFDNIYRRNLWGFGSGHGSLPRVTRGYRGFIEMFIRENRISSVVDVGCGDWQFSRLIDWGDASYLGVDLVPSVIDRNKRTFGTDRVSFATVAAGQTDFPRADLLIVKDVLQHMPTEAVQTFCAKVLPRYRYGLVTNCIIPSHAVNCDIGAGEFRPLDLRLVPYNVRATVAYSFEGPKTFSFRTFKMFPAWKKLVLLHATPD
jgi:SAM-dependent methyltransferase